MEIVSKSSHSELLRYLDFVENQHLQALSNLCQNCDNTDQYGQLLAHKAEVGELIKYRRCLLHGLDGTDGIIPENEWISNHGLRRGVGRSDSPTGNG